MGLSLIVTTMKHMPNGTGFPALMKRAKWRVFQVRDLTGVDYTTAADWKRGARPMRLEHAATLQDEAERLGIQTRVRDFLPPATRGKKAA